MDKSPGRIELETLGLRDFSRNRPDIALAECEEAGYKALFMPMLIIFYQISELSMHYQLHYNLHLKLVMYKDMLEFR